MAKFLKVSIKSYNSAAPAFHQGLRRSLSHSQPVSVLWVPSAEGKHCKTGLHHA